jgi:hypothetical protein
MGADPEPLVASRRTFFIRFLGTPLQRLIPLLCYSHRPRVLFSQPSNRVILPAHETLSGDSMGCGQRARKA